MIYLLPLLSTLLTSVAITTTPNTGDQTNGFLFDYLRSYPAPLPVIESCPAQLQFAPVTVPFGGAEPAPPFTAMYVFPLSLLLLLSPSLSFSPSSPSSLPFASLSSYPIDIEREKEICADT